MSTANVLPVPGIPLGNAMEPTDHKQGQVSRPLPPQPSTVPETRVAREPLEAMPEATLIQQARAGSRPAFGELVRRYQDAVYNLCYGMLGDPHEAEDAAQEVFIKIFRRLNQYNNAYRFSTWVLSIASHHCIDRLRKRRIMWVSLDAPEVHRIPQEGLRPEEAVIRQEEADRLQAVLRQLAPDYRLVLLLHYWYNLSYREIGSIMNLSEGAVKTKAHRARRRLGSLLKKEGWTL